MNYKEQLQKVKQDIEEMDLDNALYYSYPEIENKTFQRLRQSYITAKERIEHYIDKHTK